jgi:hypothetical protein
MKLPLTGRCACKEVTFEVRAEPISVVACHCPFCQRYSGSAFNEVMFVPKGNVEITAGAPQTWHHQTEMGPLIDRLFCTRCGTPVFGEFHDFSLTLVRVGTLDEAPHVRPVAHFWTKTKQPWVKIPEDDLVYEEFPEEFEALSAAWKKRGAATP